MEDNCTEKKKSHGFLTDISTMMLSMMTMTNIVKVKLMMMLIPMTKTVKVMDPKMKLKMMVVMMSFMINLKFLMKAAQMQFPKKNQMRKDKDKKQNSIQQVITWNRDYRPERCMEII